jgi:hypothetical protein
VGKGKHVLLREVQSGRLDVVTGNALGPAGYHGNPTHNSVATVFQIWIRRASETQPELPKQPQDQITHVYRVMYCRNIEFIPWVKLLICPEIILHAR